MSKCTLIQSLFEPLETYRHRHVSYASLHRRGDLCMEKSNINVCIDGHMPTGAYMRWDFNRTPDITMDPSAVPICAFRLESIRACVRLKVILYQTLEYAHVYDENCTVRSVLIWTRVWWQTEHSTTCLYEHVSDWKLFCITSLNMYTCLRKKK